MEIVRSAKVSAMFEMKDQLTQRLQAAFWSKINMYRDNYEKEKKNDQSVLSGLSTIGTKVKIREEEQVAQLE